MLRHLGPKAKRILLSIFDHIWKTGYVPVSWKQEHIVPILKPGKDTRQPRNYRPISLLRCVGTLMERIINRRMLWFLETRDILSPSQIGYRQNRSTADQMAYLAQEIGNAFHEKTKAFAVFFDLSKAFNIVWNEGLLPKILDAGITYKMFHWVRGFLLQEQPE